MRCIFSLVAAVGLVATATFGWAEEPQAGRLVVLEVLVADIGGAALGEGEVTAAKVLEAAAQGKADAASKIQLSALENVPSMVSFGETAPVVTGRQEAGGFPGGQGGRNMYTMQNHGTTIQATARVEQDGAIIVEMQAERSRLVTSRTAGEDAGAANIASTKTTQARVQTTTRLRGGQPAIVGSQAAGSGKDAVHTYFVLTASVPEGGAPAAAAVAPEDAIKVLTLTNARAVEMGKVVKEVLASMSFKVSADERTNSLIVTGSPEVLEIIRALINRLDVNLPEGGASEPVTKIVTLSRAKAVELVETLQAVLRGQRIKLTADPRTNMVILQGSPEVLDAAIALISKLDAS